MVTAQDFGKPATALIVAHGQPSDPGPAEAETAALAAQVSARLPGVSVLSATLANEAALQDAARRSGGRPVVVYPLFMADGWFTQTHLPQRLLAAGFARVDQLAPMGMDPGIRDLCVTLIAEACADSALPAGEAEVLLAAHGSSRSAAPANVAREVARLIARRLENSRVEAAFIDQSPQIADTARSMGPAAFCLPFFAANGGHVTTDIPDALGRAGFKGRLLAPVGTDPRVPGLIAAALYAAMASP
jgi:sirohydrochlorin ferrochelatase